MRKNCTKIGKHIFLKKIHEKTKNSTGTAVKSQHRRCLRCLHLFPSLSRRVGVGGLEQQQVQPSVRPGGSAECKEWTSWRSALDPLTILIIHFLLTTLLTLLTLLSLQGLVISRLLVPPSHAIYLLAPAQSSSLPISMQNVLVLILFLFFLKSISPYFIFIFPRTVFRSCLYFI